MKITSSLILFLVCYECEQAMSQVLTEDAKGQSAIVFGGNSINFDISQTALSINVSNFTNNTVAIEKPKMKLWGLSLYGNNASGLSALFSDGKFQPSARLQGFAGIRLIRPKALYDDNIRLDKLLNNADYDSLDSLKEQYLQEAIDIIELSHLSSNDVIKLKSAVKAAISLNKKPDSPAELLNRLEQVSGDKITLSKVQVHIKQLNGKNKALNTRLTKTNASITLVRTDIRNIRRDSPDKNMTLYVSGGFSSMTFRLYNPMVTTTIDDRFAKTPFRGGYADVGINYKYADRWLLGLSLGYERASNFDQLASTDYTVRTTDVVNNQQLISEKKYTGYAGDYKLYNRANFRTDAILFKQVGGSTSNYRLAWNLLYSRWFVSDNSAVAHSQLALGTSLNFFKIQDGGFLGGLYIQADDVTNAQQATSTFWGRLSFGLVGKYAFQTILNGN